MSHVDDTLLAPIVGRFGRPRSWDGSRELTERDRRTIVHSTEKGRSHDVTFFIVQAGRVVVIRKPFFPPGAWRPPSGGVAAGESLEQGAMREALEETGLETEITGYPLVAESVFTYADQRIPWWSHVVTMRPLTHRIEPHDTREIAAARWATFSELLGPVAAVLRASGSALFDYRADLHQQVAEALGSATGRA